MAIYKDETGRTMKAKSFTEAAERLYNQRYYQIAGHEDQLPTVYCRRRAHKDATKYAEIEVFEVGDRQGSYWGIAAANPQHHTLVKIA